MGMYTELVMGFKFKKHEHEAFYELLDCMINDMPHPELIDRRKYMLKCSSYYFIGSDSHTEMHEDRLKYTVVNIRCSFKNYSDELNWFINKVQECIESDDMLGYYRYEEHEYPTLIYSDRLVEFKE